MKSTSAADPDGGPSRLLAYAMLAATALFWGGTTVAARAAAGDIPPMTLTFWRWTVALLLFIPFGLGPFWRQRAVYFRHWKTITGLSLLGITGFTLFYFAGLERTTGVNASLMHGGTPIAIVILSVLILRERVTGAEVAGIVLALTGAVVIVLKGDMGRLLELEFNIGDILILVSMMCWALYTICLKWLPEGLDKRGVIFAMVVLAVPALAPFYGWELAQGKYFVVSPGNISLILYTAVFSSVLAFLFWNHGVKVLGVKAAGFSNYLIPVFGLIGSVLILGETMAPYHSLAIVLIVSGLCLATWRRGHG